MYSIIFLLNNCVYVCVVSRLFEDEVERSSHLNQLLGIGIGLFQGLSNIALNGMCLLSESAFTVIRIRVWISMCRL